MKKILVPEIGDFHDVPVIEILVSVGDKLEKEQSIVTVESDKATMEIPSSASGIVKAIKVNIGDRVNKDDVLLEIDAESVPAAVVEATMDTSPIIERYSETAAPSIQARAEGVSGSSESIALVTPTRLTGHSKVNASPSVRQFARELGVPLDAVQGTGKRARVTREDVGVFVRQALSGTSSNARKHGDGSPGLDLSPWPKTDFKKFGEIERLPLSRVQKVSGANLHRNWVMIPHVTNHDEADVTELETLRVQVNKEVSTRGQDAVKLTMLAFLVKACVSALKQYPKLNASLDGDHLVIKKYFHIGFAADTPNGLVVPVIRDADAKGVTEIAAEAARLAALAREGKLNPSDMQGGCFSISSLGGIGGTNFTPIINAPEVAILGVCRSAMRPVWNGTQFEPRLMMPLSLSWDHRVLDGALAARFLAHLSSALADFRRVLL